MAAPSRHWLLLVLIPLITGCLVEGPGGTSSSTEEPAPMLIAHRGASAYAPEHTLESYQLAIEQGADFVEPDLQVTKDGVLIALHDLTLERTTDVAERFPDRARREEVNGRVIPRWYASDFTLEEIRSLDAGGWFDERFRGARVPTFAETIELALGRAGIYPETKAPEVYRALGLDMERLLVAELTRFHLLEPEANPNTPVIIQSFSPESLQLLRHELGVGLSLTLLIGGREAANEWLTAEGLARARGFAEGVGPSKGLLLDDPGIVERAHAAGMTVVPYTFSSRNTGDFPDVAAEMSHFLYTLGVDGLFTNNPDEFPRSPVGEGL